MSELEPLLRFWRAHDALFEHVDPTWWGAVIWDARFPAIREPNYARVETAEPLGLSDIEEALVPAMRRSGSPTAHAVVFLPEQQTDLVAAASTRGDRVTWDLVLRLEGGADGRGSDRVEEIEELDPAFWSTHRASAALFDIEGVETLDQLQELERRVLVPAGRRWFAVVDGGRRVALAALLVLDGVGFVDHVVTFPDARGHGYAEALTRRLVLEAARAGAEATYLLADPDGAALRIYERIGFERVSHLASWVSPIVA